MEYKFLDNNELIIVDYIPGSSGQFLSRLWCELDSTQGYDDERTMKENGEVYYDSMIPKRIVSFFIEQNKPKDQDYNTFFEFLGSTLLSCRQMELFWCGHNTEFYPTRNSPVENNRLVYHLHSWNDIPWQTLHKNIKVIAVQSKSWESCEYQRNRAEKFYPNKYHWQEFIDKWNITKHDISIDFCDMLVNQKTDEIINWFRTHIGKDFAEDKVIKVELLIQEYYKEVKSVPAIS